MRDASKQSSKISKEHLEINPFDKFTDQNSPRNGTKPNDHTADCNQQRSGMFQLATDCMLNI